MLINRSNPWEGPVPPTPDRDPGPPGSLTVQPGPRLPHGTVRGTYTTLSNRLVDDGQLSAGAMATYFVLRRLARQYAQCWPGSAALEKALGLSINTVRKYLRELADTGWIATRRQGRGMRALVTVYEEPHPPARLQALPTITAGIPAPSGSKSGKNCRSRAANSDGLERQILPLSYKQDSISTTEQQQHAHASADTGAAAAVALLVDYGITHQTARELVSGHGADTVYRHVAWAGYRTTERNPAGALLTAIREDWPAPLAWRREQDKAREREERKAQVQDALSVIHAERAAVEAQDAQLTPLDRAARALWLQILRERTFHSRRITPEWLLQRWQAITTDKQDNRP